MRDNEDEEDRDSVTVQVGSAPPPEPVQGDIDGDGVVTEADVTAMQTYLRQPASACPPCDLNGNGVIDVGDMRMLWLLIPR